MVRAELYMREVILSRALLGKIFSIFFGTLT
jgi:hypothetical protein